MGTLHEVYQLTPKVISCGAVLKVRTDRENIFSEKYAVDPSLYHKEQIIFSNIKVTHSSDGKIKNYAMYAAERIIDFENPGIYVSIKDGTKYGFEKDFDEFLSEMSPYLEDAIFYVIWDFIINRYEIKNGTLELRITRDFARWKYNFEEYVLDSYASSPKLIADFYVEETHDMVARHNEMIENGDDPKELYYEIEDYEDLLSKISNYKNHISTQEFKKLEGWLKAQINE